MLNNRINISIYGLAVLPVDYLDRLGDPFETTCAPKDIDPSYRGVFSDGIRAYQLTTYLLLVRAHYGRGVANQIGNYQQRLLQPDDGDPNAITTALELVRGALGSNSVTADTDHGRMDIPIEMNIALALLLGMHSSPHFSTCPEQRTKQANRMGMDIDWSLSQCLMQAREEMERVFSPLLACIESGARIDVVETWLNEKSPVNRLGHH